MEIKKGDTTYTGVKYDDNNHLVCEECGGSECQILFFADSVESYTVTLACECGHMIRITDPRDPDDPYWKEEPDEEDSL